MNNRLTYLIILVLVAAVFWLEIFLLKNFNFWLEMAVAASLLALLSGYINHKTDPAINYRLYYFENKFIIIGLFSAAILYLIFWGGDRLSSVIFSFASKDILGIYGNKILLDPIVISLLLFFVIAPAEEVFWRGFVQDTLELKFGDNKGWIIASFIYGAVHIVAWNFMLFVAALICGFFWGYVFKRYKSLWPGIISHAIWDVTIFVLLPLK
jgi:uncharacterized protein